MDVLPRSSAFLSVSVKLHLNLKADLEGEGWEPHHSPFQFGDHAPVWVVSQVGPRFPGCSQSSLQGCSHQSHSLNPIHTWWQDKRDSSLHEDRLAVAYSVLAPRPFIDLDRWLCFHPVSWNCDAWPKGWAWPRIPIPTSHPFSPLASLSWYTDKAIQATHIT